MNNNEIKVFKRKNKLKLKVKGGILPGNINPNTITKAQNTIENEKENCIDAINVALQNVIEAWTELTLNDQPCPKTLSRLKNYTNNIKDIARTFGYDFMADTAASLQSFYESMKLEKENHHIIIKAHISTMKIINQNSPQDIAPLYASELKEALNQAIKKNT